MINEDPDYLAFRAVVHILRLIEGVYVSSQRLNDQLLDVLDSTRWFRLQMNGLQSHRHWPVVA